MPTRVSCFPSMRQEPARLKLRGKIEVELGRRKADRDKLVITEIPYTMIGAGHQ